MRHGEDKLDSPKHVLKYGKTVSSAISLALKNLNKFCRPFRSGRLQHVGGG